MRKFNSRIIKLENKKKNSKKLYKFYWADETFIGNFYAISDEHRKDAMECAGHPIVKKGRRFTKVSDKIRSSFLIHKLLP